MSAVALAMIGLAVVLLLAAVRGEDIRDVIRDTITGSRSLR